MLATLVREPFSNKQWIFEPKLDGIRCLAFRRGPQISLFSRNQLRLDNEFSEIPRPLLQQSLDNFILDGEVVAIDRGVSSFSRLQKRKQSNVPVFYYIFDLLYLNGFDLTQMELRYRKELLQHVFLFRDPLRLTEHHEASGERFFRQACRKGWEGIIAKRAASLYLPKRSLDWQKIKCENEQEFVIVGYTEPTGQRVGIGALLLGVYDRNKCRYAGKVGTGFDTQMLNELKRKLSRIERETAACETLSLREKGVHWVEPKLVAQIAFTEWTGAGKLRHPRFLGLRFDKPARSVVMEKPHGNKTARPRRA